MSGLLTITLVLTIAVESDEDREQKVDELRELAGGPQWVLSVTEAEVP